MALDGPGCLMTPEDLRAAIPALESVTYLNTGASGPSPRGVVDAIAGFQAHHEFESPGGAGMYPTAESALTDARGAIADHLSAGPDEIALTQSTTDGINLVASAIEWTPGDVVVRTDVEHSSGVLPWERLRDREGIEIAVVESDYGRFDPDDFAVEGARLVCLSSIAWNYGTRLPVAEIVAAAHDVGAAVLVDAAQSPGQHPVDVASWGADFVAGTGHKWLLGPWGGGFLYVADGSRSDLEPDRIGWAGVEDATTPGYQYKDAAAMLEVSTMPAAIYRGLEAAIGTAESVGLEAIESRIEALTERLKDGIGDDRLVSPRSFESGLVAFRVPDPEAFVERAAGAGIVLRTIPDPSCVRASVHAFNTTDEIETLLDLL